MPNRITIYVLLFRDHDGRYVGATSNFEARKHSHLERLAAGTHHSPRLQAVYNEHHGGGIRWVVLEVIDATTVAQIIEAELRQMQWMLDDWGRDLLLNHALDSRADSFSGLGLRLA